MQAITLNRSPIKVVQAPVMTSKIAHEETEMRINILSFISLGWAIAIMFAIPAIKGNAHKRVDSWLTKVKSLRGLVVR